MRASKKSTPISCPALGVDWVAPSSSLPECVEALVRHIRVRRMTFPAMELGGLADLFTQHGMPVRALYRQVKILHGMGYAQETVRHLLGLEMDGQVHGVHGGLGWNEIFDVQRVRLSRKYPTLLGSVKCYWQGLYVVPTPSVEIAPGLAAKVACALAHAQAKTLDERASEVSVQPRMRVRL